MAFTTLGNITVEVTGTQGDLAFAADGAAPAAIVVPDLRLDPAQPGLMIQAIDGMLFSPADVEALLA